ncbi:MBL fold metallo-hydrolase [Rathayibacter sp. AY1B8]|uniref:MBL fold metallo-hydrolase n=1 Tax=Rathayibacter sp. AY1B8 TaxID=2080533 RepID=UPI000CE7E928|nr:MBL fold metallo-hydrolase [Rathayibacter sp. AY1B8]PPI05195.1 hypothetical protein C5C63_14600 [Rathayibacter sp. AY1B8]
MSHALSAVGSPGESFHWSGAKRVVIDLGEKDTSGLLAAGFDPDIIILTHSDVDHIGGAPKFFDVVDKNRQLELWMPYEWAVLILFADSLSQETAASDVIDSLKELHDVATREKDRHFTNSRKALNIRLDENTLHEHLKNLDQNHPDLTGEAFADEEEFIRENLQKDRKKLARDIFNKAKRLQDLLMDALRGNRVRFRWFSVDHIQLGETTLWKTQGLPEVATIANAVEVELPDLQRKAGPVALVLAYRLTIQNRRSLISYLWPYSMSTPSGETSVGGGIVWSDGDGSTSSLQHLPWTQLGVCSAPHHGSAKDPHTPIWDAIEMHAPDVEVILAGGRPNQGLHASFTKKNPEERACTQCGISRSGDRETIEWPPLAQSCKGCRNSPRPSL